MRTWAKAQATVAYACGSFCENVRSFIEPLESAGYLVTLRTDRYAFQFTLDETDNTACNWNDVSAHMALCLRTQQCCRELLNAERTGVLP